MSQPYRHADIQELLGAYALDAVDDDERLVVEDHLPTCPECRAEVAEHRELVALLATPGGGAAAPEGLWDRIASELSEGLPALDMAPVRALSPLRAPGRRSKLFTAALAVAAVVIAVLGVRVGDLERRVDTLQVSVGEELERAAEAATLSPDARVAELRSTTTAVRARAAVLAEGSGYLNASALPALDPGRTYQLWGTRGDQVVSLGVLGPDPEIVTFHVDSSIDGLAVSAEDEPMTQPSATPVLLGSLV